MPSDKNDSAQAMIGIAAFIAAAVLFVATFPRLSAALFVAFLAFVAWDNHQTEQLAKNVAIGVASHSACAERELLVAIKNNHPSKKLQNIRLTVDAFKPSFSDAVVSGSLYTDQIIPKGKVIQSCLKVEDIDGDRQADFSRLNWEFDVSRLKFEE